MTLQKDEGRAFVKPPRFKKKRVSKNVKGMPLRLSLLGRFLRTVSRDRCPQDRLPFRTCGTVYRELEYK